MMDRFSKSGFEPVEYNGELVHPMYRASIAVGDVVRVTWVSAASPLVQGVTLRLRIPEVRGAKGRGGLLRIEGVEAPGMALWMDTAPPVVEAECVKLAKGAQLRISNTWRQEDGSEDEWYNNYGIKIEPLDDQSVLLHCSDGNGFEPTFDDLVVRVDLIRHSA